MGVPYYDAIRPMPICTSLDHRQWCYELYRYRLAENPIIRPGGSIYVSNAGNDSNAGTIGSPIATIVKANELIAALSQEANRTIYLARGSVWTEQVTLLAQKDNISLASYGTGKRPFIDWFEKAVYTSWSATAGRTNVWEYPGIAEGVCAVRYRGDVTGKRMFAAAFTLDQCEDHPYSYYWDVGASKLYVNFPAYDIAPNNNYQAIEYLFNNQAVGIDLIGDRMRCHDIRVDGAGGTTTGSNAGKYSIHWTATGTDDSCVVTNCEGYYSEAHNIGATYDNTYGTTVRGSFLVANCRAGGMTSSSHTSGGVPGTLYVGYANNGGQELLCFNNTNGFGNVPNLNRTYAQGRFGGGGVFGHSPFKFGLAISVGTVTEPGQYQVSAPTSFGAVPVAATLADRRVFVIEEKFQARSPMEFDAFEYINTDGDVAVVGTLNSVDSENQAQAVYINCDIETNVVAYRNDIFLPAGGGGQYATLTQFGLYGMYFNCVIRSRFEASQLMQSIKEQAQVGFDAGGGTYQVFNTLFEIVGSRSPGIAFFGQGNTAAYKVANSIFALSSGAEAPVSRNSLYLDNDGAKLLNNAYLYWSYLAFDITGSVGYSNDPYKYAPQAYRSVTGPEPEDSELISEYQQLVEGYALEYDKDWKPRAPGRSARGPWEYIRQPQPAQLSASDLAAALILDPDFVQLMADAGSAATQTTKPSIREAVGGLWTDEDGATFELAITDIP